MNEHDTTSPPWQRVVAAERSESGAWADWYAAAPPPLRERWGLRVQQVAGATLFFAPGLPVTLFNRVVGLGLARACTSQDLQAVVDVYCGAGVSNWTLQWTPRAVPADLPAVAQSMGFAAPKTRWAKMARGAGAVPEVDTDLRIDEVGVADADGAAAWADAVAAGNDMPALAPWLRALHGRQGWRLYLATDAAGQAAGGSALFIAGHGDGGASAWLGMGAVRPSHQRRHAQAALMARRVADALAAGAAWVFTETGEPAAGQPSPSLDNMRRCGFVQVASRFNLAGPAA